MPHSLRKTATRSVRAARRAGIAHARAATMSRTATAASQATELVAAASNQFWTYALASQLITQFP
jgi:hypothetical protein